MNAASILALLCLVNQAEPTSSPEEHDVDVLPAAPGALHLPAPITGVRGEARLTAFVGARTFAPGFTAVPSGGFTLDVNPALAFDDFEVRLEQSVTGSTVPSGSLASPVRFSDTLLTGGWRHAYVFLDDNTVEPAVRVGYALPISNPSRSIGSIGGLSAQAVVGYRRTLGSVVVAAHGGLDGTLHPLRLSTPICDLGAAPDDPNCRAQSRGPYGTFTSDRCPPGSLDGLFRHACSPSPFGGIGLVAGVDVKVPDWRLGLAFKLSGNRGFLPPLNTSPELSSPFADAQNQTDASAGTLQVSWSPVEHIAIGIGISEVLLPSANGSFQLLFLNPFGTNQYFAEVVASL